MLRQVLLIPTLVIVAFVILFISITQTAQVKYSFNPSPDKALVLGDKVRVEYHLPYTGRIAPDHVLWPLKALRDRIWILVTPSSGRKAELNLLFANKRLVSAKSLFQADKPELGMSVLTKAEKYLEDSKSEVDKAKEEGVETKEFLYSLSLAALKHREVIDEILEIAPDDAKPDIAKTQMYAKTIFESCRDSLISLGALPPVNPFEGE